MSSFGKNDTLSVKIRKIGNSFYQNKDYEAALSFYQQSLVLASSRENKALIYGNISAIFAAVKNAKSSISNMEAAKKLHTPIDGQDLFLEKLSRREKECEEMKSPPFFNTFEKSKDVMILGNKDNPLARAFPIGLPLTYPSNPKVPGLVDRIGKTVNTLYATTDLRFGDVIAVTRS